MDKEYKNCRMCLCKCENPMDMLIETDFAAKVMNVFPKISISPENGFSTSICEYCHEMIEQFYEYFKTVNANQDELLRKLTVVSEEKVYAFPLEYAQSKIEPVIKEIEGEEDKGWLDEQFFDDVSEFDSQAILNKTKDSQDTLVKQKRGKKGLMKDRSVTVSKVQKENLDYIGVINLPINYSVSYVCPICSKPPSNNETKNFKNKTDLNIHIMKTHLAGRKGKMTKAKILSKNALLQCDICQKSLKHSISGHNQQLDDHKFFHYDLKPYKCDKCSFSGHTKNSIRRHLLHSHNVQIKSFNCFYCQMEFLSKHLRESHVREVHPHKMITCDMCGEKLPGKRSAVNHFRDHLQQRLTFQCDRCPGGIRFPDKTILNLHLRQHIRLDKKNALFSCHLCEQKFNKKIKFDRHLQRHASGQLIACHICGKTIQSAIQASHNLTHQKKSSLAKYKCEKCDKLFRHETALTRHINNIHESNMISCHRCGKMINECFMKRHLNYCTYGELKCTHCPMTFTKESARQLHNNRFHTGFKCKRCNIIFENRKEMDFHQRYDEYHVMTKSKKNVENYKKPKTVKT